MKFCPHCGVALTQDAKFCPGCGKPLAAAARKSGWRFWAAWLLITPTVLIIALMVLGYIANRRENDRQAQSVTGAKATPIDLSQIRRAADGKPSEQAYDLAQFNLNTKTGYDLDASPAVMGGNARPPRGGPASMRN